EVPERFHGDDDVVAETAGGGEARLRRFGELSLFVVVVQDGGTILAAAVRELPLRIGGVDLTPENLQKGFIRDFRGVVGELHGFGVSGLAGSDLFIRGRGVMAV